jgi:cytochrome c
MVDSWEFNKIAGAVLSALLLAFGAGTVADIIRGGGHGEEGKEVKPGFELPVTDAVPGGKPAAAPAPFDVAEVMSGLKTASPDNGQAVFGPCKACHTTDKGGKPLVGPNLWGIVGRETASSPNFPRYSAAMKNHKGQWTFDRLAKYLHDPRAEVPGNQMAFAGVKSNTDLADLLAFLRTLNDNPPPLPN